MIDDVINLFVHRSAAKRYAAARPYFHPRVVHKICQFTNTNRFERALDVACGTGQSARALATIAEMVDAVDISAEMIAESTPLERVRFAVAAAERLPFVDGSFDLATVGLAFHWFDQAAFLAEARRVLRAAGWLVIYTSNFNGKMAEDESFRAWAWEDYPKRFPTPPRRSFGGKIEDLAKAHGFVFAGKDDFAHDELMSADQLTGYLMTQTNVIWAVESGTTPLAEAATWITAGVEPFFGGALRTMKFGGSIWYLRRDAT
jgi:ubiquinone/menaquinone biosynthesis C-methylase UbiE